MISSLSLKLLFSPDSTNCWVLMVYEHLFSGCSFSAAMFLLHFLRTHATETMASFSASEFNFMIDIWRRVNLRQIPTLTSLSCNVIYFSLKQDENLCVFFYTGGFKHLDAQPNYYCNGLNTLQQVIQTCLPTSLSTRISPGFELAFKKVCEEDLYALGLPPTLIRRYFTFPLDSSAQKVLYYQVFSDDQPPIRWWFPTTQQCSTNRKSSHDNSCRQRVHHLQWGDRPHCASRLHTLGCNCLFDIFHSGSCRYKSDKYPQDYPKDLIVFEDPRWYDFRF